MVLESYQTCFNPWIWIHLGPKILLGWISLVFRSKVVGGFDWSLALNLNGLEQICSGCLTITNFTLTHGYLYDTWCVFSNSSDRSISHEAPSPSHKVRLTIPPPEASPWLMAPPSPTRELRGPLRSSDVIRPLKDSNSSDLCCFLSEEQRSDYVSCVRIKI